MDGDGEVARLEETWRTVSYVVIQQRLRLLREGLGELLAAEDDIEVVGTAATCAELLALCNTRKATAVILQADAVDWDPIRVVAVLRSAQRGLRVIGLTRDVPSTAEVSRAQRSGIAALVPRCAGTGPILDALRNRS